MYVRMISRKNKDGSRVTYVQLAHNIRDKEKGYPRAEVIYSFGRADRLDIDAIKRLIKSLSRLLSAEDAAKIEAEVSRAGQDIKCLRSMPMGGSYLLRRIWENLGFGEAIQKAIRGRKYSMTVEWAIYAMVANRALASDSKRAIEEWARKDVWLGNEDEIELQHLYRGMDILLEAGEELQREIYYRVADLLNLEVDLIFFDTTSTYMEIEGEDEGGLRRYGHSKDRRSDLPQVALVKNLVSVYRIFC